MDIKSTHSTAEVPSLVNDVTYALRELVAELMLYAAHFNSRRPIKKILRVSNAFHITDANDKGPNGEECKNDVFASEMPRSSAEISQVAKIGASDK